MSCYNCKSQNKTQIQLLKEKIKELESKTKELEEELNVVKAKKAPVDKADALLFKD
jgi:hypothetical protein